ncbi:cupin domain-containing protein [Acetobacter musti]|uniref:Cupin domain-containing protein n=1 Tax=Acetobacter musti TaxID=864732 RepID=A0ABX0JKF2_9PROT|nr:oxalate decarboxylase family bicupin [Acetobacter musti]NHN83263.1 cupin domain-containing protein [Acetobacter musti]
MMTDLPWHDSKSEAPEPIRGDRGASILGPRNLPREREVPDLLASPDTDAGTIPNLKFSYADARNRLGSGGWAREITIRELPAATTLAGVNMRLKPGGYRELHYHKEAEWGFMIAGKARVTALDTSGHPFVDDVEAGDIWNFPAGIPHSIQGLGNEGCEFLLVFDDANFSENETFLISDWFAHTPRHILAKNFGVPESAFANLPTDVEKTRWIFSGTEPTVAKEDAIKCPQGPSPIRYTHRFLKQEPAKAAGGTVRVVDSRNFPAASTIAAAINVVEPGRMRELHWHPNNDEWQYFVRGRARMTVFASGGKARTFDYCAGDVGYVPLGMGHYLENIGDEPMVFLEAFKSDHFADFSANQWLGLSPRQMVKEHLNLDDETLSKLRQDKPLIV